MHWALFFSVFGLIFAAEFPDKTAFATMVMAARGKPLAVFLGVAAAFLVQTIFAVVFGGVISLAPEKWVHLGAALVFLAFAAVAWLKREEGEEEEGGAAARGFLSSAGHAFLVIFIAEWGDITQLATATFVAHNPHDVVTVFVSAVLALWAATGVTVLIGVRLRRIVSPALLQRISAFAFAAVGFYMLYEALR